MVKQPDSNVQSPLHTSGVLLHHVIRPLGQTDNVEHFIDPPSGLLPTHAIKSSEGTEILIGREIRIYCEFLWYVADASLNRDAPRGEQDAVNEHLTRVPLKQTTDHGDGCRFASPVRTQETICLSFCYVEADPFDGDKVTERLSQFAAFEDSLIGSHLAP